MSKNFDINSYQKEEDFKNQLYDSLNDPDMEIEYLHKWRKSQINKVPNFIHNKSLNATEQYTNLDHFLLELLQNADDTSYKPEFTPTVRLILEDDRFILENNETGFTSEDVFAITYAAASTKTSQKTAGTFIGEKGIGFKSVFAVAEQVDIHSGKYDFRLRDKEYIVPYKLSKKHVEGTQIILWLKQQNINKVREIVAERLNELCHNAQEFILFLQKIEKLEIENRLEYVSGEVTTLRDKEHEYHLVESFGCQVAYISLRYPTKIPAETVKRLHGAFSDVDQDIEREIVFAVPRPTESKENLDRNGRFFCFLPTKINTGTPLNVQVDAKTTTNRENILDPVNSEWNNAMLSDLADYMTEMYLALTNKTEIRNRIPEYWPYDINEWNIGNDFLQGELSTAWENLKERQVILDKHGQFRDRYHVRMLSSQGKKIFHEPKYEKALTHHLIDEAKIENVDENCPSTDSVTFVDAEWTKKYVTQLEAIGISVTDENEELAMLQEGPPAWADLNKPETVRQFLEIVMDLIEDALDDKMLLDCRAIINSIKQTPIFPVQTEEGTDWCPLSNKVMWLHSDTFKPTVTTNASLIDPQYTYTPGGGGSEKRREQLNHIRQFNRRFRDFLSETLEVTPYSQTELLRKTTIQTLRNLELDPSSKRDRQQVTKKWTEIYNSVWNRRKTIINEQSDEYWTTLLAEIGQCNITASRAGENTWCLVPLNETFLGPQFTTEHDLEKEYEGTGAPILHLEGLGNIVGTGKKRKSGKNLDWADWREFLWNCGVFDRPYIIEVDLSKNENYCRSTCEAYQDETNFFAQSIKRAIEKNHEYQDDPDRGSFVLRSPSETIGLDPYTEALLDGKQSSDFVAYMLCQEWNEITNKRTIIHFLWGYKQKTRMETSECLLIEEQIRGRLLLQTDQGLQRADRCFWNNPKNRSILEGQCPLLLSERYAGTNDAEEEFLKACGVNFEVQVEHIRDLIDNWYKSTSSEERMLDGGSSVSSSVLNFVKQYSRIVPKVKADLKLYSPQKDELVSVDHWREDVASLEGLDDAVQTLAETLFPQGGVTAESLADKVVACLLNPTDKSYLISALYDVGRYCYGSNKAKDIEIAFRKKLDEFYTEFTFPLLWDQSPAPNFSECPSNIIVVPPNYHQSEDLKRAAHYLGWPLLSNMATGCHFRGEPQTLTQENIYRTYCVITELTQKLSQSSPQQAQEISNSRLFESPQEIENKVTLVTDLCVSLDHSILPGGNRNIPVPYWFEDKVLRIEQKGDYVTVLANFLDQQFRTTVSPFLRDLWDNKEIQSRIYIPQKDNSEDKGTDATGSEYPSTTPGRARDGDLEHNQAEEPKTTSKSKQGDEDKSQQVVEAEKESVETRHSPSRQRLCSYVSFRASSQEDDDSITENENAIENEQVENAGREVLLRFCREQEVECCSVESECRGYDFELRVGGQTLYIELKASQSKWKGWEYLLTPNEFRAASELKENYFLCFVDCARSSYPNLYFIQNPLGKADGYLFDHPWKHAASDMNKIIWHLKTGENIQEE